MKRLVYAGMRRLGVPHLARFVHRNELTILLYHGVAPESHGKHDIFNYRRKFIKPDLFDRQMRYFQRHYRILPLDEAIERRIKRTLPAYALAITFDDGYRNFYEHAYPILKRLQIPATMYLATDFVFNKKPLWVDRLEYTVGRMPGSLPERAALDKRIRDEYKKLPDDIRDEQLRELEREVGVQFVDFGSDRDPYAPLSLDEIREMTDLVSFGPHSKTHPILSRLPHDRAEEEIRHSAEKVRSACGAISTAFAYPNGQPGDWTPHIEEAIRLNGFTAALTTVEGFNGFRTHPYRLRRIAMDGTTDETFAVFASGMRLFLRNIKQYAKRG